MEDEPLNPVARELLEMSQLDREMRTNAQKNMEEWDDSIDLRNTARLKEIIAEIGWPTLSKVGSEASQAAWLLVQHASAELDFMKQCLELMRQTPDDVRPSNIAFLEDRLLIMEDKPQIYGTQFRNIGNGWEPFPIEDSEHVDERRASVGLGTLAENEARIKAIYSA